MKSSKKRFALCWPLSRSELDSLGALSSSRPPGMAERCVSVEVCLAKLGISKEMAIWGLKARGMDEGVEIPKNYPRTWKDEVED